MLKEALKYILELSKPEEIEVDGKTYFDSATYEPAKEFYPDTLTINNLTGIVDYLKEGPEAWDNGFFVHVRDFNRVVLYQAMAGDFNQRVPILVARARGCQFDFGNKMGVESFIIALRSMFLNNDDQEYLLKFVSGVKVDANATIEDDGRVPEGNRPAGDIISADRTPHQTGLSC